MRTDNLGTIFSIAAIVFSLTYNRHQHCKDDYPTFAPFLYSKVSTQVRPNHVVRIWASSVPTLLRNAIFVSKLLKFQE